MEPSLQALLYGQGRDRPAPVITVPTGQVPELFPSTTAKGSFLNEGQCRGVDQIEFPLFHLRRVIYNLNYLGPATFGILLTDRNTGSCVILLLVPSQVARGDLGHRRLMHGKAHPSRGQTMPSAPQGEHTSTRHTSMEK